MHKTNDSQQDEPPKPSRWQILFGGPPSAKYPALWIAGVFLVVWLIAIIYPKLVWLFSR